MAITFKDAIRSGLEEYLRGLRRALDGLTPVEVRWQASPSSNHIAWIVWHMARVEDAWIARARELDHVWAMNGWAERLGFGEDVQNTGGGWSIEQVVVMPEVRIADLLEYYTQVRERTLAELDKMTDADLERKYEHPRMGTLTIAWIMGHIIVEESQHLGQIAFIRGMQRGLNG